ncbi:hypothetical protein UJ101_00267 [Flavobacteriaceae bacterium UJ101]|nr:hypothetical protein UJ101_00267 [Flavobacteriaceae bacterium UJ101]
MKLFWKVLQILLGVLMMYGGVQHFVKPDFYIPFVPYFIPFKAFFIYASGVLELLLGITLFIPKYSKIAATGILILMLLFLPIHIGDVFSDTPAIGSHQAALIRLPIQFLFIAWAYKVKDFVSLKK